MKKYKILITILIALILIIIVGIIFYVLNKDIFLSDSGVNNEQIDNNQFLDEKQISESKIKIQTLGTRNTKT